MSKQMQAACVRWSQRKQQRQLLCEAAKCVLRVHWVAGWLPVAHPPVLSLSSGVISKFLLTGGNRGTAWAGQDMAGHGFDPAEYGRCKSRACALISISQAVATSQQHEQHQLPILPAVSDTVSDSPVGGHCELALAVDEGIQSAVAHNPHQRLSLQCRQVHTEQGCCLWLSAAKARLCCQFAVQGLAGVPPGGLRPAWYAPAAGLATSDGQKAVRRCTRCGPHPVHAGHEAKPNSRDAHKGGGGPAVACCAAHPAGRGSRQVGLADTERCWGCGCQQCCKPVGLEVTALQAGAGPARCRVESMQLNWCCQVALTWR